MTARRGSPIPVLYIGGTGRSGSTLFDRSLGEVSGCFSTGEVVHIWEQALAADDLCGCGERFSACPLWSRVGEVAFGGWDAVPIDRVIALKRSLDRQRYLLFLLVPALWPAFARRLDEYVGYLSRLYAAIAEVSGAKVVVDSSKHVSYLLLLRRVPGLDVRLLHLVRDARGIAYSWMKQVERPGAADDRQYLDQYQPATMALRWLLYNLQLQAAALVGVRRRTIRYEDFVAAPGAAISVSLALADRPSMASVLPFVAGTTVRLSRGHGVAGNPMKFRTGAVALKPDLAWQTSLPRRHRVTVSVLAAPLLAVYGYLKAGALRRSSVPAARSAAAS